jgi:integrase
VACRCRQPGWMKFWPVHERELVCRGARVISCGIRVLTRLREQGMALEAVQAQAGHASIESTRIYLHLANDWLEREYLAAAEAIDAQLDPLAGELAS